jgi:hypothetical protein
LGEVVLDHLSLSVGAPALPTIIFKPNVSFLIKNTYSMKKAKLFLTAVALIAVVGGALAFKASRCECTIPLYIETFPGTGDCNAYVGMYVEDLTQPQISARFFNAGPCQILQVNQCN